MVVITEQNEITIVPINLPAYKDIGIVALTPALSAEDYDTSVNKGVPQFELGPAKCKGNSTNESDCIPGKWKQSDDRIHPPVIFRTLALSPANSPNRKVANPQQKKKSPVQFSNSPPHLLRKPNFCTEKPKPKNPSMAKKDIHSGSGSSLLPIFLCTFAIGVFIGKTFRS